MLFKNTRLLISCEVFLCVFPLFSFLFFLTMIQAGRSVFFQMESCEKMLQSFYLHRNAFLSLQFIARFAAALLPPPLVLPFDFLFPFMHVIWKVCLCNGSVIKGAFFTSQCSASSWNVVRDKKGTRRAFFQMQGYAGAYEYKHED